MISQHLLFKNDIPFGKLISLQVLNLHTKMSFYLLL